MGCTECAQLTAALASLQVKYDVEVSRRTRGSTPPPSDENWANAALPPPDSASDPTAPPLWSNRGSNHKRHL